MKITDIRLRRLQPEGKMRAYASVTFDEEFVVHEMRVIDGPNGLFVAMPSRRAQSGEFKDIAHPITAEARREIQTAILYAFAAASTGMAAQASASIPVRLHTAAAASAEAGEAEMAEAVAQASLL